MVKARARKLFHDARVLVRYGEDQLRVIDEVEFRRLVVMCGNDADVIWSHTRLSIAGKGAQKVQGEVKVGLKVVVSS